MMIALLAGLGGYFTGVTQEERGRIAHADAQVSRAANSAAVPMSASLTDEKPKATPTFTLPDPNVYFPGTEALARDEMRVIACGTGMPTARESQAAPCWLVELGNGDKFIFDCGTGSSARMGSLHLPLPYDYLNKIFISHLHTDHFGDFSAYFHRRLGRWSSGAPARLRSKR